MTKEEAKAGWTPRENTTFDLLRSVYRKLATRDAVWMVSLILMAFVATHTPPESTAALIKIDDRDYFRCPDGGCWWKVRDETTWADLARRINADPERLRADNPQASHDVLQAGQLIRLRERSEAAH